MRKLANRWRTRRRGGNELRLHESERGTAMLEYAVVLPLFLAFVFTSIDFYFFVYAKATLRHAVLEGARYAIIGQTMPGLGQDASIKAVVQSNAMGLLNSSEDQAKINVRYYAADGSGVSAYNTGGNMVAVSVENYAPPVLIGLWMGSLPGSIKVTVSAVDKLEPFTTAPPR